MVRKFWRSPGSEAHLLALAMLRYSKKYYEAEIMENVYDEEKSTYESMKVHLIAMSLFFRDDENILYIGILLVFLSIIIYFVNITTS